jgi:hypothetical protein
MMRANGSGDGLELLGGGFHQQQHFVPLLALAVPPVMRLHAGDDVHAGREARLQEGVRDAPGFVEARGGDEDEAGSHVFQSILSRVSQRPFCYVYSVATKTINVKKIAGPVDAWFKKAAGSRGVRIKYGRKTYILFDAKRVPKSYAEREYDVTRKELDTFAKRTHAKNEKVLKSGLAKTFTGNIEDLL